MANVCNTYAYSPQYFALCYLSAHDSNSTGKQSYQFKTLFRTIDYLGQLKQQKIFLVTLERALQRASLQVQSNEFI